MARYVTGLSEWERFYVFLADDRAALCMAIEDGGGGSW